MKHCRFPFSRNYTPRSSLNNNKTGSTTNWADRSRSGLAWMQTRMTIIAREHTQSTERITHRQRPTSLFVNALLLLLLILLPRTRLSRWIKRSGSLLECRGLTSRHIATVNAISPIYPNRWSSYFSLNHTQQVRERQWSRHEFVRPMSTRGCELYLCASPIRTRRSGLFNE